MKQYSPDTRVELTATGWLAVADYRLQEAEANNDRQKQTMLRQQAAGAIARAIQSALRVEARDRQRL
jgi:hypothetical protein